MRTTLDVDEKLLETMLKMTGEKSKSKVVNKAMKDYIRRRSIDELRAMAGKIMIDDLQQEQRAADELRQELLDKLRRGEDGNR